MAKEEITQSGWQILEALPKAAVPVTSTERADDRLRAHQIKPGGCHV